MVEAAVALDTTVVGAAVIILVALAQQGPRAQVLAAAQAAHPPQALVRKAVHLMAGLVAQMHRTVPLGDLEAAALSADWGA